jgi:hypothetical protein
MHSTWEVLAFFFLHASTNERVTTIGWFNLCHTRTLAEAGAAHFTAITPRCPWFPDAINWAWVHIAIKVL